MLKKSRTRFAYVRKLLALPLLFILAFSYLVTAKNREIAETNKMIAETVAQLQDTVKNVPPPAAAPAPPAVNAPKTPLVKAPKVPLKPVNREKIDKLSKDLRRKTRELKRLKPETPKFNEKVKEINQLTQKIQQNVNWPHVTAGNGAMVLNFNDKDFRLDLQELEKHTENLRKHFDSEEFKARMKSNEAYFKSKKFKEQIEKARLTAEEFRVQRVDQLEARAKSLADSARFNASKYKDAADLARRKANLAKEREELAKKREELAKKQADLMKKEIELYGNVPQDPFIIVDQKAMRMPLQKGIKGSFDGAKITIDGKPATEKELKALRPDEIARMDVNKSTVDGESRNEIKVETKKK